MSGRLEIALYYAERGWQLFPLAAGQKVPLAGTSGFKEATSDPVKLSAWWSRSPGANIGLATGAVSGVWALDIDMKGGKDGFASLADFAGAGAVEAVTSIQSHTASGGRHIFFASDPAHKVNSRANILSGVDIRGEGGYVVLPPSTTTVGAYRWANPDMSLVVTEAPDWARRLSEYRREKASRSMAREQQARLPWNLVIHTRDKSVALEDVAVGTKLPCRCPFHDDRTPSAFFSRLDHGRGFLHCSSCGTTWHTEAKTMSADEARSINQELERLLALRGDM